MTVKPFRSSSVRSTPSRNELAGHLLTDPIDRQQAYLFLWSALYRQLCEAAGTERSARLARWVGRFQQELPTQLYHPFSRKVVRIDGRYFWRLAIPGFPSPANTAYWAQYLQPGFGEQPAPRRRRLCVTGACPMAGFEERDAETAPSLEELIKKIRLYRNEGAGVLILHGGEPMLRRRELPALLRAAGPGIEGWLETTGYNLTEDRARALKAAGLTGLYLHLDDSHAEDGDRRRRYPGAFDWTLRAAVAARRAGLVVCLNFHASPDNVTPLLLEQYLELAYRVGAAFVRFLDPPATTPLSREQYDLLEAAYLLYNSEPAYADYPIVEYPGYEQRRNGSQTTAQYPDLSRTQPGDKKATSRKAGELALVS